MANSKWQILQWKAANILELQITLVLQWKQNWSYNSISLQQASATKKISIMHYSVKDHHMTFKTLSKYDMALIKINFDGHTILIKILLTKFNRWAILTIKMIFHNLRVTIKSI